MYHSSWHIFFRLLMFAGALFFWIWIFKNCHKFRIRFVIFRQPLLRRFSCMLGIIILLENVIRWYLKTLNRRHKIFLQDLLILLDIHFAHTFRWKTSPNHYTATVKFDSWYRVLWWVGFVIFPPHMILIIMTK